MILIMTIYLFFSMDLHLGPFPLFFYVNCGYFLGLPGFRLNSQGKTLCVIIAVFSNMNVVNFVIFIQVQIIYTT